jgi:5,10-methylenetetrahydromethanopterin reductase
MRYGLFLGGQANSLQDCVAAIRQAAADGFHSAWLPQIFGIDALTALAVAGASVPDIELGTAVVPTYPRHPMALASQALTVQAASGNRLVLGIGLSHQVVVEGMWGYSFDKPARHMREYLAALMPFLRGEAANVQGETLKAIGQVDVKNTTAPPVLIAALAPVMLKLAGAVADGTATWMVGPTTLNDHITPSITAAASDAGRPAPRIAVGLPVCLTNDADGARERAAKDFVIYGQLPSYRAMLDREGVDGPAGIAIVGDETAIRAGVQRIADAGGTDFIASCYGSADDIVRTTALLANMAG